MVLRGKHCPKCKHPCSKENPPKEAVVGKRVEAETDMAKGEGSYTGSLARI